MSQVDPPRGTLARTSLNGLTRRWMDIRPGEGRLVLGACLALAGIVGSHVLLETARDALFLSELPASSLSIVYALMAVLGYFAGRYDQLVSRAFGRQNALVLALMGASVGTMLFYLTPLGRSGTILLYLWTGLVGTLLTIQFWLTAAQRFTPGQGRRLYGLVAAGGVLGAVVGGALGALLVDWLSVRSLLVAASAFELATAFLVTLAPPPTEIPEAQEKKSQVGTGLQWILSNAYLRRIGLLTIVSGGTLLFTDYLFKSVVAARFQGPELAAYLARFYATMNGVALVVQLFIAMQVLQRMGTILALGLLPLCLLFSGGAAFAFGGTLVAVLLAKGADGALRHSLNRVSTELLFLPLSSEERAEAKPLFDSVLARGTQGAVALAILGLAHSQLDSPRVLGVLILAGSFLWLGLAWSLRAPYLEQLRGSLGNTRLKGVHLRQLNFDSVGVLVEALSSPEEARVIGAMGLFHQAGRSGLIPALVLYHPSPRVLERALEIIPSKQRKDWVPLAERLLDHESIEVRMAAVRALGKNGYVSRFASRPLEQPRDRATAAFFLAEGDPHPERHPALLEFLGPQADPDGRLALLEAITTFGGPEFAEVVLELQKERRPELDRLLPMAMARVRDPRFIPLLVARLAHREGRDRVRDALADLGEPAFEALVRALYQKTTDPLVQLHIPRAISRFGTQAAADLLVRMLSDDLPGAVRYKALRGLGRLAQGTKVEIDVEKILPVIEQTLLEHLRLKLSLRMLFEPRGPLPPSGALLAELLENKREQSLERATRLLQLLHPREDLRRVYYALLSGDLPSRIAAAEILEVTSLGYSEELRTLLRVAAEPKPEQIATETLAALVSIPEPSPSSTLLRLLEAPDSLISALAAAYASELSLPDLHAPAEAVRSSNVWLLDQGAAS